MTEEDELSIKDIRWGRVATISVLLFAGAWAFTVLTAAALSSLWAAFRLGWGLFS